MHPNKQSAALTLKPLPSAIHGDIIGQFISVLRSPIFVFLHSVHCSERWSGNAGRVLLVVPCVNRRAHSLVFRRAATGRKEGRKEGHGTHPTHIEGREGQSVCTTARKRGARGLRLPAGNIRFLDMNRTVPPSPSPSPSRPY